VTDNSLEAFYIADDLRKCIEAQLLTTHEGMPGGFDSCVTAGRITWDNCCPGSLRVAVQNQYPTERFPDPPLRPTNCDAFQRATNIQAVILRCAPGPNADGDPPPCEKLEKTAQILSQDMDALWRGAICCFRDTDLQYMVRSIDQIGPNGQCVGTSMTLVVGLTNWCNCG